MVVAIFPPVFIIYTFKIYKIPCKGTKKKRNMQITMHFIRFFNKYFKFITLFISTLFHRNLIGTSSEAHRNLALFLCSFQIALQYLITHQLIVSSAERSIIYSNAIFILCLPMRALQWQSTNTITTYNIVHIIVSTLLQISI